MLHAVIMAGGTGTRFWPASRAASPKQLLSLVGKATMIRQTYDRLDGLVTPDQTLIITNRKLVEPIKAQLPELPAGQVVGEPCKRDTAPCIGLAALLVSRDDPDATMVVMPADHVIRSSDRFQAAVRQAVELVEKKPGRIVTFGIQPTYAAEIFGYIQRARPSTLVVMKLPLMSSSDFARSPMPRRLPNMSPPAISSGTLASSSGRPRQFSMPWPSSNR